MLGKGRPCLFSNWGVSVTTTKDTRPLLLPPTAVQWCPRLMLGLVPLPEYGLSPFPPPRPVPDEECLLENAPPSNVAATLPAMLEAAAPFCCARCCARCCVRCLAALALCCRALAAASTFIALVARPAVGAGCWPVG